MLIDVNASFGGRESSQQFTVGAMLGQLRRMPCRLAFVRCRQGMTDQIAANDQTFALCRDHEELRPVAVIHPRETFAWRDEVRRCLAKGVRLFQIYPDQGSWAVDSILLAQLIDRLAGSGAALMVEATTPGLPSTVARMTADAGVPVIFTEARYFPLSELLPLAQAFPHVHIETGRLTSPEAIERCVEALGPDRLLFGSGSARYPAWVSWQVLERAAISESDREAIAWRNASRLLGLDPAPIAESSVVPVASVVEDAPIIDVHLHDKFPGAPIPGLAPSDYEAALKRSGIMAGVCSSVTGIFYDLAQGNAEMADLVAQVPRLRGYVVVDPRYYDDSCRELDRWMSDVRFVGVKIHAAYSQTPTGDQAMRRLVRAVAAYGKPLLIHNLGKHWPEELCELAAEHPRLPIIAAHAGYGDAPHPTHDAAMRLAPAANVFLEFCSTYLASGAIRRGIEAVGVDRVLFGSDFPLIAQPYMRAAYEDAELNLDEMRRVYILNALQLFPAMATGAASDASPTERT